MTTSEHFSNGISPYNRNFFDGKEDFTYIGQGELGGKAQGLAFLKEKIFSRFSGREFSQIDINIPNLTVITTHFFDLFIKNNNLLNIALSDESDERIAHHFQKAELPADLLGDLRDLIAKVHTPLAIRSSSLMEDSANSPFAGIYETKMIPNNQFDTTSRFRKLVEAIKFVYASTFFKKAKDYMQAAGHSIENEKMAVIIQEVVGLRHDSLFYPSLSGVARSYNFYPIGHATPEDGVINLALGLGKTIVDGDIAWSYSPAYPMAAPPYNSIDELLEQTQTRFWAVNMGKPPAYDPIKETEYLVNLNIVKAEDNVLRYIASTYDVQSDRISMGINARGPRIINFAPVLQTDLLPINTLLNALLQICEDVVGAKVEIEFAMTFPQNRNRPRLGILQVRPMVISEEMVEIEDIENEKVLVASTNVLGNGCCDTIQDIVYVKPETFNFGKSKVIASQVEITNRRLLAEKRPYLLIGFGRWGSSDPWLGIPVNWGQISGAKTIIEATLERRMVDLSQGTHFFHNISNLRVNYFSVKHSDQHNINWQWLQQQQVIEETDFIKHVRLKAALSIKVDGRKRLGVILIG